jgi:shikimate 5-dehydrogenase
VLCFGAGAKAISLHLIRKPDPADRPRKVIVVNRSQANLDSLQRMVSGLHTDIVFEYIQNSDPQHNDAILARMPEGSLVINAAVPEGFPRLTHHECRAFPRRHRLGD